MKKERENQGDLTKTPSGRSSLRRLKERGSEAGEAETESEDATRARATKGASIFALDLEKSRWWLVVEGEKAATYEGTETEKTRSAGRSSSQKTLVFAKETSSRYLPRRWQGPTGTKR